MTEIGLVNFLQNEELTTGAMENRIGKGLNRIRTIPSSNGLIVFDLVDDLVYLFDRTDEDHSTSEASAGSG